MKDHSTDVVSVGLVLDEKLGAEVGGQFLLLRKEIFRVVDDLKIIHHRRKFFIIIP